MADYGVFHRAGVNYPLPTGDGLSLLRKADPFLFYGLEFFRRVIELHLEPALLEAATGTDITRAVATAVPVNPMPHLESGHIGFPLLAMFRVRGRVTDHTVNHRRSEDVFEVVYVLPALNLGEAARLTHACKAVRDILDDRAEVGFDPGYTPTGAAPGTSPWALANVQKVEFTDYSYGFVEGLRDLPFYGLTMRGIVQENDDPNEGGFEPFHGADVSVDVAAPDGTVVLDVAADATFPAPTIGALSPSSGPVGGGTTVAVVGTGFRNPVDAWIGGVRCLDVVVHSETELTLVTPPQLPSAIGAALDLKIVCDDQPATKAGAFTYTA